MLSVLVKAHKFRTFKTFTTQHHSAHTNTTIQCGTHTLQLTHNTLQHMLTQMHAHIIQLHKLQCNPCDMCGLGRIVERAELCVAHLRTHILFRCSIYDRPTGIVLCVLC